MHELQLLSSNSFVLLVPGSAFELIALYGDRVEVFKQADAGSDNTIWDENIEWLLSLTFTSVCHWTQNVYTYKFRIVLHVVLSDKRK